MSVQRHVLVLGLEVRVVREDFYWVGVSNPHEDHLSEKLFQECEISIITRDEFAARQDDLERIHNCLKSKTHRKGFIDGFRWQDSDYTESHLLARGFKQLSRSTITAVADENQRYEIKFVYLVETPQPSDKMASFCKEAFADGEARYPKLAGQSVVTMRGNKSMAGKMLAFGSWDAYGSHAQNLGTGVKQIRVYGPTNNEENATSKKVHTLIRAHVDDLTSREKELTPACAASRSEIANRLDPGKCHRMSEKSDAFSMTVTANYIADPHSDSAASGVLEFIKFINVNGPLPQDHRWLFAIAGCILELPNQPLATVIVALPGQGIFHGTLPTSSTEDTYQHGNFGSALITKQSVCEGLERQKTSNTQTPRRYCSSRLYFGGGASEPLPHQGESEAEKSTEAVWKRTREVVPDEKTSRQQKTTHSQNESGNPKATLRQSTPATIVSPALERASFEEGSSPPGSRVGETIGSGGCTAWALTKLGVYPSGEVAKSSLNEQLELFSAKVRPYQRVPEFLGVPDDRWHKETVQMAVTKRGFHFRKLDLSSVDLSKEFSSGKYLVDGILNNSFVKRVGRGAFERFDTDPDDTTNPRQNPGGWRHSVAVCDGRVLEKEFVMSAMWLWLKGSTPDPDQGYMLKILRVVRIYKCVGTADCKGIDAAGKFVCNGCVETD